MRSQLQVTPYFPEPVVVAGNIAGSSYSTVLGFTRRVIMANVRTSLAVFSIAMWFPLPVGLEYAATLFFGALLAMTFLRRLLAGGAADNLGSALLLVPTVISFGTGLGILADQGYPVIFLAAVPVCSLLYSLGCGRDFNFFGMFVIGAGGIISVGSILVLVEILHWTFAGYGILIGVLALAYFTYDLASLLRRRRVGEEPAAAADLYRDLLNFLTYSVRVILHWRKFRFI